MNPTQRRKCREDGFEDWSMTFHGEVKKLWAKVKDRTLKPMDLCVASYLQSHIQTKTGRIEVRTKDIAEDSGECKASSDVFEKSAFLSQARSQKFPGA